MSTNAHRLTRNLGRAGLRARRTGADPHDVRGYLTAPGPLGPRFARALAAFSRLTEGEYRALLQRTRLHRAVNWRRCVRPSRWDGIMTRDWLNNQWLFPGVDAMITAARDLVFVLRDGLRYRLSLPHNFGTHGTPLSYQSYRHPRPFDRALMVHYARAGGWLAGVAAHPGLLRLALHSTSVRGENSPQTHLCWPALAFTATASDRWDGGLSPGRLWRRVRAIHRRAQALLCPRPDAMDRWLARWRAVDLGIQGGNTRRAAFILAARKRVLHGAWYPGWHLHADPGRTRITDPEACWESACGLVTTYRAARAVLAVAGAADPAAVIESSVVRPEWRASAYTYLSRALIAALDPTT